MFRWKTMKTTILSRGAPESQKDPSETKGEASFQKVVETSETQISIICSQTVPEQLKNKK